MLGVACCQSNGSFAAVRQAPLALLNRKYDPSDFARIPDPRFLLRPRDQKKLRIANFIQQSGSAGIWGPASVNSSLLAAAEVNKRGGILGREIEIAFYDAGGNIDEVADTLADIVSQKSVDVIMGSHTSAVRVALRKEIGGQIPYIYTPVYEGGERSPGVMAIGETPRALSRPAIEWLATHRKAQRWYLIGSDYVWPWLSHRSIKSYINRAGGRVVGEEFVPVGEQNHHAHLERIRAARPDVVLISLIGNDSILFNRAFAQAGLARHSLRLAGAMDETLLLGIGADNSENMFCASGYFLNGANAANDAFRSAYDATFGRHAPPAGSVGQSNYEGIRFLEAAASRAESLLPWPLAAASANMAYTGGRGTIDIKQRSAKMPIFLAQADGLEFNIIKTF